MRWRQGRRSTNVEDLRGRPGRRMPMGRRGGGMKLGGGAGIIMLLLAVFFGGDLSSLLGGGAGGAGQVGVPQLRSPGGGQGT